MRLKQRPKINRSLSQDAHTSSCLHWSVRFPIPSSNCCLGSRHFLQHRVNHCFTIMNWTLKRWCKVVWNVYCPNFLMATLLFSGRNLPLQVQGPATQCTGKCWKRETVGHLVDHSCGDPLQDKLPILYNQYRACTRQSQHSNSSLSRRDFTSLRYPTETSFTFPCSAAVTLVYYHV